MAIGLYTGSALTPQQEVGLSVGEQRYQKIQDIIRILDERYVDTLNGQALFEQTIADMLHRLDPHSNYIPAEQLKAMNEAIEGKFGGVGVRFFIIRDTVCITNVIEGSPAEKAGLKAGDKIIEVDGKKIASKKVSNEDLMSMLKGEEGTGVNIRVLRKNKILDKKVIRGSIPVESVIASYMITSDIGYIRVDQFSIMTAEEFRQAAASLRNQGLKKLILDVRDNGGGVLTGATEIADEFLGNNVPIVETRGEHSLPYTYRATSKGSLKDVELVVLVNSNSASASEILAGAIQDNDRGTIVGRRSFGKGLVQEDFALRDGSNLRLTIARYYTPTGRCIQKPYTGDYDAYYEDQLERYDNGEMYKIDSSVFVDSLKFKTPKGKVVYGGGGIMPDIFVPYDSTGTSWYYTELRYSAVFNTFAFDYVQNKRSKWRSAADFNKNFTVTDDIIQRFAQFAYDEYDIKKNEKDLAKSKVLIARVLKAEMARQLWVEQGFYQVFNTYDPDVLKAIKFLR